jgi:ribosomal protein L7/L12
MTTIVFAVAIIGAVLAILVALNQLSQRVEAANETLRKISKHLGVHDAMHKDLEEELKALVKQGKKIEAIRLYRRTTGLGLKEAHDHIEQLNLGENDAGVSR